MAQSTLFGLRLFNEGATAGFPNKGITIQALKGDGTKIADTFVTVPNELSLLEARKFLDDIGITKKLNEYRRVMTVLGGKVDPQADGSVQADGALTGYAKDSSEFYQLIHNEALSASLQYLKRVNELMASGYTFKDAQSVAKGEYERLIASQIKVGEGKYPISVYFDEVKRKLKITG